MSALYACAVEKLHISIVCVGDSKTQAWSYLAYKSIKQKKVPIGQVDDPFQELAASGNPLLSSMTSLYKSADYQVTSGADKGEAPAKEGFK